MLQNRLETTTESYIDHKNSKSKIGQTRSLTTHLPSMLSFSHWVLRIPANQSTTTSLSWPLLKKQMSLLKSYQLATLMMSPSLIYTSIKLSCFQCLKAQPFVTQRTWMCQIISMKMSMTIVKNGVTTSQFSVPKSLAQFLSFKPTFQSLLHLSVIFQCLNITQTFGFWTQIALITSQAMSVNLTPLL